MMIVLRLGKLRGREASGFSPSLFLFLAGEYSSERETLKLCDASLFGANLSYVRVGSSTTGAH